MSDPATQVDRNFDAFLSVLPQLLRVHPGKFALMRDARVHSFHDTALQAVNDGTKLFGIDQFSVQEVTGEAEDLGFYSYAGGAVRA